MSLPGCDLIRLRSWSGSQWPLLIRGGGGKVVEQIILNPSRFSDANWMEPGRLLSSVGEQTSVGCAAAADQIFTLPFPLTAEKQSKVWPLNGSIINTSSLVSDTTLLEELCKRCIINRVFCDYFFLALKIILGGGHQGEKV